MIFSKGKICRNLLFKIDGKEIQAVSSYLYLNIVLSESDSFLTIRKYDLFRGKKSMYVVLKKSSLFVDRVHKSDVLILIYGCEILALKT